MVGTIPLVDGIHSSCARVCAWAARAEIAVVDVDTGVPSSSEANGMGGFSQLKRKLDEHSAGVAWPYLHRNPGGGILRVEVDLILGMAEGAAAVHSQKPELMDTPTTNRDQ
jgi:hypothetical protein